MPILAFARRPGSSESVATSRVTIPTRTHWCLIPIDLPQRFGVAHIPLPVLSSRCTSRLHSRGWKKIKKKWLSARALGRRPTTLPSGPERLVLLTDRTVRRPHASSEISRGDPGASRGAGGDHPLGSATARSPRSLDACVPTPSRHWILSFQY